MAHKLLYCPHCKQNILPLVRARGGAGCVVFLVCLVVGPISSIVVAGDAPTFAAIICIAWWLGGFAAMMYMAHDKKSCPKCGMSARGLGKAL